MRFLSRFTFIIFLFCSTVSFGQEKFEFSKDSGLTDYVIVNLPDKSKSEIYTYLIKWIKQNYVNSDEVIQTTIENEMIRFKGYYSDKIGFGKLVSADGAFYLVQIDIREGRIKIDPNYFNVIVGGASVDYTFTNQNTSKMFRNDELKPMFVEVVQAEVSTFNNIITSIQGLDKNAEDDW